MSGNEEFYIKHWSDTGFTLKEAEEKAKAVDEAHSGKNSRWNPAEIVKDERGGYKIRHTWNPRN